MTNAGRGRETVLDSSDTTATADGRHGKVDLTPSGVERPRDPVEFEDASRVQSASASGTAGVKMELSGSPRMAT